MKLRKIIQIGTNSVIGESMNRGTECDPSCQDLIQSCGGPVPKCDLGPMLFRDDRPGEPAHIQGEVVDTAWLCLGVSETVSAPFGRARPRSERVNASCSCNHFRGSYFATSCIGTLCPIPTLASIPNSFEFRRISFEKRLKKAQQSAELSAKCDFVPSAAPNLHRTVAEQSPNICRTC